jgi:hypothetical protein
MLNDFEQSGRTLILLLVSFQKLRKQAMSKVHSTAFYWKLSPVSLPLATPTHTHCIFFPGNISTPTLEFSEHYFPHAHLDHVITKELSGSSPKYQN